MICFFRILSLIELLMMFLVNHRKSLSLFDHRRRSYLWHAILFSQQDIQYNVHSFSHRRESRISKSHLWQIIDLEVIYFESKYIEFSEIKIEWSSYVHYRKTCIHRPVHLLTQDNSGTSYLQQELKSHNKRTCNYLHSWNWKSSQLFEKLIFREISLMNRIYFNKDTTTTKASEWSHLYPCKDDIEEIVSHESRVSISWSDVYYHHFSLGYCGCCLCLSHFLFHGD